jgi:carbonic anhydrase/acetyltransferase-like protein (isoleucine patch superfamily)
MRRRQFVPRLAEPIEWLTPSIETPAWIAPSARRGSAEVVRNTTFTNFCLLAAMPST